MVWRQCDGSRCHSRMRHANNAKQIAGHNGHNASAVRLAAISLTRVPQWLQPTIIPIICFQRPMRLTVLCPRREDPARRLDVGPPTPPPRRFAPDPNELLFAESTSTFAASVSQR